MRPEERNPAFLIDMYDAACEVTHLTNGLTFEEYLKNRLAILAVERLVEIIGEAARGISEPFRLAHPEIPWRRIIAQRHVLAHEYGDIDQTRMWHIARVLAPELAGYLRPLLTYPPGTNPPEKS